MMRTLKFFTLACTGMLLLTASSLNLFGQSYPIEKGDRPSAQETKNQDMVLNWYRDAMMLGHVDQAAKIMADDYIEHDPRISGGKTGFVRYYQNPASRPAEAKQITSFGQGDYVIIVWSRDDKDPKTQTPYKYTTYDVVRLKNGKVQEHWNNAKKETKW